MIILCEGFNEYLLITELCLIDKNEVFLKNFKEIRQRGGNQFDKQLQQYNKIQ
jgi:hypothetical protein